MKFEKCPRKTESSIRKSINLVEKFNIITSEVFAMSIYIFDFLLCLLSTKKFQNIIQNLGSFVEFREISINHVL